MIKKTDEQNKQNFQALITKHDRCDKEIKQKHFSGKRFQGGDQKNCGIKLKTHYGHTKY